MFTISELALLLQNHRGLKAVLKQDFCVPVNQSKEFREKLKDLRKKEATIYNKIEG